MWAEHAHGVALQNLWVAFSEDKLGLNVQHYSNMIAAQVTEEFKLPKSWSLKCQLVFGGIGVSYSVLSPRLSMR